MTYEEAISELETIKRVYANMRKEYKPCVEALQMAIDALRVADTPQTEEEILREQCRAFMDVVKQTDCGWK